jgi:ribose transport system substrate-binding protein
MLQTGFARAGALALFFIGKVRYTALILALSGALFSSGTSAKDLTSIGVLVGDLSNPFFETIGRRVEASAAEQIKNPVRVTVRSSGYDLGRQVEQIKDFIENKTDLVIINAVDTVQIAPVLEEAREAGVVVVAVDTGAAGAQATVQSDNFGAGSLACQYLADELKGKGDILIMNGPPVSSVTDRVDGCKATLAGYPGIRILADDEDCGGSVEGGLAYMTETLNRYARIDAVFAINDPTALGADIAASRAGRTEFFIVSIDGSARASKVIAEGKTRLKASVIQDPLLMTDTALRLGISIFSGDPPDITNVSMPIRLLTKDNIVGYQAWDSW